MPTVPNTTWLLPALAAGFLLASTGEAQERAPTPEAVAVQPGAPGQASRRLGPEDLIEPNRTRHAEADVRFMQGMIVHHRQALVMTGLVPERSRRQDVSQLADRIDRSQDAEIAMMARWLAARGEAVPTADAAQGPGIPEPAGMHGAHGGTASSDGAGMAGMLTEQQLATLAAAEGEAFDRIFLEFMIQHHEGALEMVETLFSAPGAAQDSDVFDLASHVYSDQLTEIGRMRAMLSALP